MATDSLQRFRDAGTAVDNLNDEQRAVLRSLNDNEVEVLTSVQARLAAAGDDVEAQGIGLDDNFRKY